MQDLFFYVSKVLWMIISPDTLFLLLLTLAILLLFTRKQKTGKGLLVLLLLLTWVAAMFPLGNWLFYPLEKQFSSQPQLPEKVDGIIVLGGSVLPSLSSYWHQLETGNNHERLSQFILLARQYPDARLVFSGGNASLQRDKPTEADQVRDYFLQSGIDASRLILENQARNTYENAVNSKRLVHPIEGENWVLITSAYHMPRSVGIFCRQHWPVIPYPVDHTSEGDKLFTPGLDLADHVSGLVEASHEWVGLLAYYATGKIDRLIPRACTL
jgi:uncharacterized SAM-binding protein YcdF (DUF218 family)